MSNISEILKAKYGALLAPQVEQDINKAKEETKQELADFLITQLSSYQTGSPSINKDRGAAIIEAVREDKEAREDRSDSFENVAWRVEVRNAINQSKSLLNVHQVADIVLMNTGNHNPDEDMKKYVRKKVSIVLSQLNDVDFKRWESKKEGELSGTFYYGLPDKFEGDEPKEGYKITI